MRFAIWSAGITLLLRLGEAFPYVAGANLQTAVQFLYRLDNFVLPDILGHQVQGGNAEAFDLRVDGQELMLVGPARLTRAAARLRHGRRKPLYVAAQQLDLGEAGHDSALARRVERLSLEVKDHRRPLLGTKRDRLDTVDGGDAPASDIDTTVQRVAQHLRSRADVATVQQSHG